MFFRKTVSSYKGVTYLGAFLNILLALGKIAGGLLLGSASLVADGIHSLSDLLTDAIVLVGIKAGGRPPDNCHQYGHGKYETISALLVSIVLVMAGFQIAWNSARSLLAGEQHFPGPWVLVVALISILVKEYLFRVTFLVARREHSAVLQANAWHHRSDALSSVAVFLGGIAGVFGWGQGDMLAGLVVGLMIILAGARIGRDILRELTEHAISDEYLLPVETLLQEHPKVQGWHKLRSRRVGRELFLDVHVLMDPLLSVADSHALTEELEQSIASALPLPVNCIIHVEPAHTDSR